MLSGVYRFPAMESVVLGKPFVEALAEEVDRVEARAVFILASGTLARETDTVDRLHQMLGNRLAGVCAKIGAHTPRTSGSMASSRRAMPPAARVLSRTGCRVTIGRVICTATCPGTWHCSS